MTMKKILVAYATLSGSTAEVAQVVGEEIAREEVEVDVLPLEKVAGLSTYDAIILGAPMILGWHRSAVAFLKKQRKALEHKPLAIFATAMSLTATTDKAVKSVPLCIDQNLAKPPRNPQHLTFRENYANITRYSAPMLNASGNNKLVSIAFFGGRLDYYRLKPLARLFVILAVQTPPGDRRNWQVIRTWAGSLPQLFNSSSS